MSTTSVAQVDSLQVQLKPTNYMHAHVMYTLNPYVLLPVPMTSIATIGRAGANIINIAMDGNAMSVN